MFSLIKNGAKMVEDIFSSVQKLTHRVCGRQHGSRSLVPKFFNVLLNYDGCSKSSINIDVVICYIRLIARKPQSADALESQIGR